MTIVEPIILFTALNLTTASVAKLSFGWVPAGTIIASPIVAFAILVILQWVARSTSVTTRTMLVLAAWVLSLGALFLLTKPEIAVAALVGVVAPIAIFLGMLFVMMTIVGATRMGRLLLTKLA